ncbi:hypothetical protein ANN_06391 [Periplaneta americana]|uniref:Uncharacterized protein n=1 Tax=Periplaneta americana TaxID=6978 RepID=A0ABQ8TDL0_PERAM|nr:hypothetical protein ANN_06391 [Periplaneta americana]
MASLCEGCNEPAGSLKAMSRRIDRLPSNPRGGEMPHLFRIPRIPSVSLYHFEGHQDCGNCAMLGRGNRMELSEILKAVDHDHPPSLEEVEALRRCIRLKRAAENEPVAGPAQIIQRELERAPSGVFLFLPLRELLRRNINEGCQRKFISNPKSLSALHGLPQEFRITTSGKQFLMFDSFDDEDHFDRIIMLPSKSHLRKLSCSATWYLEGTFHTAPDIFTQIL